VVGWLLPCSAGLAGGTQQALRPPKTVSVLGWGRGWRCVSGLIQLHPSASAAGGQSGTGTEELAQPDRTGRTGSPVQIPLVRPGPGLASALGEGSEAPIWDLGRKKRATVSLKSKPGLCEWRELPQKAGNAVGGGCARGPAGS